MLWIPLLYRRSGSRLRGSAAGGGDGGGARPLEAKPGSTEVECRSERHTPPHNTPPPSEGFSDGPLLKAEKQTSEMNVCCHFE